MKDFLPVLGGLGLFLYGMTVMGTGLEKVSGNKLKKLIEALTTNRLMGVLIGMIVTMIIQSSSGTTVMVVGFVNAGMMNLSQAVGVIMGANIGTTITSQLIAFKLTDYAPIAIILGVILWLSANKRKSRSLGEILIGFGILFLGMDLMSSGLSPLAGNPVFTNAIVKLENPILGAITGLILTTVVQSSSASVGILQALASEGLLNLKIAFPIIFGENIGTTTTALVSSTGASRDGKRAAMIHFLFNLFATLIFLLGLYKPVERIIYNLSPLDPSRQIANANTIFNVLSVIIFFPFANYLVKLSGKIVRKDGKEKTKAIFLDNRILSTPSIAIGLAEKELIGMNDLTVKNLNRAFDALVYDDESVIEEVYNQEELIDKLEKEVTDYLVKISQERISESQHGWINDLLYAVNDIERIGDHAENLIELAEIKYKKGFEFSEEAVEELEIMFDKCLDGLKFAVEGFFEENINKARVTLELEEEINKLEKEYRSNHIDRLNQGMCLTEAGVIFLDTISNLERISDHATNIASYALKED